MLYRLNLFAVLFSFIITVACANEVPDKMKTKDGKPRYWAWAYAKIGGPASFDRALVICREFEQWGVTDIIWETPKGAVPWPTEVKCAFTDLSYAPAGNFKYNYQYDRIDALCRAAQKYDMKIWFSHMGRDGAAMDLLFKNWRGKGGPEFAEKIIDLRKKAGLYAKDDQGRLIKYGVNPWKIHFDLAGNAYLQLLKDLLTELKEKYGRYDVIRGFVLDEFELTLLADPLSDDIKDFSSYCEKNFGEKYTGKSMPQLAGVKPENIWWRREMLFRIHIMNRFLKELTDHAHKLGFEIIKPNRNLEGANDWPWKCGMDINAYSSICDYVWIATRDKAQLDPYLNYDNMMVGIGMAYGKIAERFASSFHGKPLSDHAFPCGTTINNLAWYTDAERKLFMGHQNNKNWFNLFNSWTGGKSPAKVAIAINSPVFTMQYPKKSLDKYNEYIAPLFEELSLAVDVDGFQFPQLECLKKYPLIIVPHGVPMAMNEEDFKSYMEYVRNGGVILSINARWTIGRKDMSALKDVTYEIMGCRFQKASESGCGIKFVPGENAKKLMSDDKGNALVCEYKIGSGKVISFLFPVVSKISLGDKKHLKTIAQIIKNSCVLPIEADGNIQILQTVQKDEILAVTLRKSGEKKWDKNIKSTLAKLKIDKKKALELGINLGEKEEKTFTLLKIDANALGITGKTLEGRDIGTHGKPLFSVKNIITGRTMQSPYRDKRGIDLSRYACSWTGDELLKGIPVELKYENEFAVIAISGYEGLGHFSGVMPGMEWSDAKSNARDGLDTPTEEEMGLNKNAKNKKGIRVGIFVPIKEISKATYGAKEVFDALKDAEGIAPLIIDDISSEKLKDKKIKVLIYCQSSFKNDKWIENLMKERTEELRKWVKNGGGLLAKHDASGYRYYPVIFPEICKGGIWHSWGVTGPDAKKCAIKNKHSITRSFKIGEEFEHSYDDHVQLQKGPKGEVIIIDKLHEKPVMIAGEIGKGRFIADGTLGHNPKTGKLSEAEKKLLINSVEWLSGK